MKYRNLALILCLLGSLNIEAKDVNKSFNSQTCCKQKRRCAPTPISKATTIETSGAYCLTQDIVGTIVIAADNVTFDLNSHVIDGNQAVALSATGVNNITIKNGAITNADLGISITNAIWLRPCFSLVGGANDHRAPSGGSDDVRWQADLPVLRNGPLGES